MRSFRQLSLLRRHRNLPSAAQRRRKLHVEALEDRRLLTGVVGTAPAMHEYAGLTPNQITSGITAVARSGTDIWFTEQTQTDSQGKPINVIGVIDSTGEIKLYPILDNQGSPLAYSAFPNGIALGSRGSVWFTEGSGDVVKFDPGTGLFKHYATQGHPTSIAAVFDEDLVDLVMYYTDQHFGGQSYIGRINPDGTGFEKPLPIPTTTPPSSASKLPFAVAEGPDGNAWFTEIDPSTGDAIGRMTPAGVITEFPLPQRASAPPLPQQIVSYTPEGITQGPDGTLWFTEQGSQAIGRITPAGVISQYIIPSAFNSQFPAPTGITTGPDGNLWFTESQNPGGIASGYIGQLDPSNGQIAEFPVLTPQNLPGPIAWGGDGNLWFGESHYTLATGKYDGFLGRADITPSTAPATDLNVSDSVVAGLNSIGDAKFGQPVTIQLTVTNKGQQPAQNVIVYDPIPTGVSIDTSGSNFTTDTGTASVSLGLPGGTALANPAAIPPLPGTTPVGAQAIALLGQLNAGQEREDHAEDDSRGRQRSQCAGQDRQCGLRSIGFTLAVRSREHIRWRRT